MKRRRTADKLDHDGCDDLARMAWTLVLDSFAWMKPVGGRLRSDLRAHTGA